MARARNIKPSFFTNLELGECSPLARLLFIGLWCIADRKGRLEDKPKQIKIQTIPYDDANCDELLNQLNANGFITRYTIDGKSYIEITNFLKHQNPHLKEKDSEIPSYIKEQPIEIKEETKEQEKYSASSVQEQEKHETIHAESLNLNPESLNLNPESLNLNPEDITQIENDSHKPKKNNRKTKLADDFVIPDDWISLGVELRPDYSEQQVKDSAFRFKNYHISKGNAMASWIAAWRNWITHRFVKADNIRQFPDRKQSMQSNVGQVDYYAGTTIGPNGEVFF